MNSPRPEPPPRPRSRWSRAFYDLAGAALLASVVAGSGAGCGDDAAGDQGTGTSTSSAGGSGEGGSGASTSSAGGAGGEGTAGAGGGGGGGGGCGDLQTDPENCGACGHSCLGGTCQAGHCEPLELYDGPSDYAGPVLDDTHVYVAGYYGGEVVVMDKTGSTGPQVFDVGLNVHEIALSATHIYLRPYDFGTETGAIWRLAKDGTGLENVVADSPRLSSFHIDAMHLFWTQEDGIYKMPLAGGAPAAIYQGNTVASEMVGDAAFVYVTEGGSLDAYPKAGGSPVALDTTGVSNGVIPSLALDSDSVFVGSGANPFCNGTSSKIGVVPKDGSGIMQLLAQPAPAYVSPLIASEEGVVYWFNQCNGALSRTTEAGVTTLLWTDVASVDAAGVAVDAQAVYWTQAGRVLKLAK